VSAVAVFPDVSRLNPYQRLLQGELERRGVEVTAGVRLTPLGVLRARRRIDAVHLHWLEILAFDARRRWAPLLDALRAARLWLTLLVLRAARMRVVWTVHNLHPHELARPRLYGLLRRTAARVADDVVVHSRHAAELVRREFRPRGEIHVAAHGSYVGWYAPATAGRDDLRERYGLPDDGFVFLLFGQIRPYKRVAAAIETFRTIEDQSLRLLVAGSPRTDDERRELDRAAAGDRRVELELRWIPDEEVAPLHRVSDAVVLNYGEDFSSGALMLAWSLGVPVVAPAGGTVDEIAAHGPIERFEPGRLAGALVGARERWGDGARQAAEGQALGAAEGFAWTEMATLLERLYEARA
jgi:beta-1,4-mannosyltransferase